VRSRKVLAVVLERVQLRAELHTGEQQRQCEGEERSERADHDEVRCNMVANLSCFVVPRISRSADKAKLRRKHAWRHIAPDAKVGASTSSASSAAEGSLTVIRHSVRGSSGSVSVAECSSDALSQMTTSPTR